MSRLGRGLVSAAATFVLALVAAPAAHAQWSAEATVEHFTWHEDTAPISVDEKGPRFGGGLRYLQPKTSGPLVGARARVWGGGVDYAGSFQFDATRVAHGTSTYFGGTLTGELRYRWPAIDATSSLEFDTWRRRLSESQHEDYTTIEARLGVDRPASDASPFTAGGGIVMLLAANEQASIVESGVTYALEFSPGLGAHGYAEAGYRVAPRVTLLAYWDGMSFGRSNSIVLTKRGRPQVVVSQPPTDMSMLGLRFVYGW